MTEVGQGSGHVDEELALLLGGELGRDQLQTVVRHLRGCTRCRQSLVDVSAAHASLTAARRVLDPVLSSPVDEAWSPAGPEEPLPVLAPIEPEVAAGSPVRRTGRLHRRDVLVGGIAAASAAAIALGGVAASGNWPGSTHRPVTTASTQQARLEPVVASPAPQAAGLVRMTGTGEVTMTIRIRGLAPAQPGHFYYAWLLDAVTKKMLPVGVVDPAGASTFDLGGDLVKHYTAVDISLQADDGDPAHSTVSVLRATYGA